MENENNYVDKIIKNIQKALKISEQLNENILENSYLLTRILPDMLLRIEDVRSRPEKFTDAGLFYAWTGDLTEYKGNSALRFVNNFETENIQIKDIEEKLKAEKIDAEIRKKTLKIIFYCELMIRVFENKREENLEISSQSIPLTNTKNVSSSILSNISQKCIQCGKNANFSVEGHDNMFVCDQECMKIHLKL